MREYARQRGLRRLMIPVPFLTPRLSSLWLGLVTPLFARVGRKLIDSIRHPTVVRDDGARHVFKFDTDHFAPSRAAFMINYRVADLSALVAALTHAAAPPPRPSSAMAGRGWGKEG